MTNFSKFVFLLLATVSFASAFAHEPVGLVGASREGYPGGLDCGIHFKNKTVYEKDGLQFLNDGIAITKKEDLAALKELKDISVKIFKNAKTYNFIPHPIRDYATKRFNESSIGDSVIYQTQLSPNQSFTVWEYWIDFDTAEERTLQSLRDCEAKRYVELVDKICDSVRGPMGARKSKNQKKFFSAEASCKI